MKTKVCTIIPTYNNGGTIADVIARTKAVTDDIIVVDDGCTDGTADILAGLDVITVTHPTNKGKGSALMDGFRKAAGLGYTHAVTIDADGQHYPEEIPSFLEMIGKHPDAIIVGSRHYRTGNMPGKNSFANRFSNFWFTLQTGLKLDDTQSGFRAYPLDIMNRLKFITGKYEAELEFLVFPAWKGTGIISIPIRVYYPPADERVTHFRPGMDFMRISILNTFLCIGALLYGLPAALVRKFISHKQMKG